MARLLHGSIALLFGKQLVTGECHWMLVTLFEHLAQRSSQPSIRWISWEDVRF